jgi:hypothetical protein
MVSAEEREQAFKDFPALVGLGIEIASKKTRAYNCIAWSLGVSNRWFWPDPRLPAPQPSSNTGNNGGVWPYEGGQDPTLETFEAFYQRENFFRCSSEETGNLEKGKSKIVLYVYPSVRGGDLWVDHASRQLSTGEWASKMGENVDIIHRFPRDLLRHYSWCTDVVFLERVTTRRKIKR